MNSTSNDRPLRGRPRDPELEGRVFDAVMQIYAHGGWSALTFEAVARESGVGKSSLYRRWDSQQTLLHAAMKARWLPVHNIDTGSLHSDLRALAQMIFDNRTGDYANMSNRLLIDAARFPELREVSSPYMEETVLQARAIIRRAAARGEVPSSLNHGLLMDLVVGAVNNHVLTTPPKLRKEMQRKAPSFLDELVKIVLRGVEVR
ncbi:MAG: TetR-like C-terminal domain-containing protein [Pseudomonadales bacterium]|nr:TetR-like C-terminal domain-containing protein [Pseudomonadales bacterium]MDC3358794.1 TetR/AcrR family transcriptional regulator C-terminal ligand-binding domain-containing protein [Pseudomonadales bacterium]MDG1000723.1 TetR-like C-terminal domain-containing protein [Pseudomonadales bacterium]MDG1305006.1 TetR-like C-terminal domain-containing protein [Pseudomonadales bacterium]